MDGIPVHGQRLFGLSESLDIRGLSGIMMLMIIQFRNNEKARLDCHTVGRHWLYLDSPLLTPAKKEGKYPTLVVSSLLVEGGGMDITCEPFLLCCACTVFTRQDRHQINGLSKPCLDFGKYAQLGGFFCWISWRMVEWMSWNHGLEAYATHQQHMLPTHWLMKWAWTRGV